MKMDRPAIVLLFLFITGILFSPGCTRQDTSTGKSTENQSNENQKVPASSSSPGASSSNPANPPETAWVNFTTGANVKALAIDRGQLWMGLSNGMIRYDTRTMDDHEVFTPDSTNGGLMSEGIYTIKVDSRGNKWIGTYGGGMTRFNGTDWKTFTVADGLGDQWVYDIEFKDGIMWIATWKGVSVYDGKTFKNYTEKDGLLDKWVYAIALDRDNVFWFGTESGVNRFDGKSWTGYTHKDGLGAEIPGLESPEKEVKKEDAPDPDSESEYEPDYGSSSAAHHANPSKDNIGANPNFVIAAAVDHQNGKWFGTWGAGISRFDGKNWATYTKKDGLGGNFIHAVEVDSRGRVWAGTNGGVSWFDGTVWRTFSTRDGLVDDNVFSIVFDSNGDRWFGTWRGISRHRGSLPS